MSITLEEALSKDRVLRQLEDNPRHFRFPVAPVVRVVGDQWVPHLEIKVNDKGQPSLYGPQAKTLQVLASSLNFTYDFTRPPDGSWGLELPNKSWSGMVGMVHRKEVHLGLGPFAINEARAKVVEYSPTISFDYSRLLVIQKPPEANPWSFVFPFSAEIWIAVLLSLVGVTCCVALLTGAIKSNNLQQVRGRCESPILFHPIRILLQQDMKILSTKSSIRILLGSWCLLVMILLKAYAGTLTSLLTVRYIPRPVNSLKELIDDSSFLAYIETDSAISSAIMNSKTGIISELKGLYMSKRVSEFRISNIRQILFEKISSGNSALFTEDSTGRSLLSETFSKTGKCQFFMADDYFLPNMFGMIGQKEHPLMPAVFHIVQDLIASGLYNKWVEEMLPNGTVCNNIPPTISVNEPYSVTGLWGIFVLLAGGLSISSVIFLLEVMRPKFKGKTEDTSGNSTIIIGS